MEATKYFREQDVDGFKLSVFQTDEGFHIKASNPQIGQIYKPIKIFEGIGKKVIEAHLSDEITIKEVGNNFILIQMSFYDEPLRLEAIQSIDTEGQVKLLKIEVDRLKEQNKALENEIKALKADKVLTKKQYHGVTTPSDWLPHSEEKGVYVKVDIQHLNLQSTPHVIACLVGNGWNWLTTSSIYFLTKSSFEVYVRFSNGDLLTVERAKHFNWCLHYTVTSLD